jgi:uncharacterized alpha-E superfamily protein
MSTDTKPLLSRVADSVYWMARYMERAENVARFIGVNLHLHLDMPMDATQQWQSLVDTSGDAAVFRERYGVATQHSVLKFLVSDAENPNSIVSCMRSARENARSVRETISSEMWEQINSLYLLIQKQNGNLDLESLPEFFRGIRMECHQFQGITDTTMTHNEAWHFLRMGRKLERADKTSRMLDVKYFMLLPSLEYLGTPYDDIHWSAVLKSASAFEMYRKKYGRLNPRNIVDFLLMDMEFPRAIRYCVHSVDQSLHAITGTPAGSFRHRSEQLMGQFRADLDYTSVDSVLKSGLHEFLDGLQAKMNTIDDYIQADFCRTAVITAEAAA